jgi:pantoate--beta-alanine ligase
MRALSLSRGLFAAARSFAAGQTRAGHLVGLVKSDVARGADTIDYVTLADADSLAPIEDDQTIERAVLAIAVRIGKTRLIDNFVLGEDPVPSSPTL